MLDGKPQLMTPQTINKILREAGEAPIPFIFWLASKNYEDAPHKQPDQAQQGTEYPIDESFTSEFVGKKVEDAADWMKNKPDNVALDANHFVILDKRAEKDGTVVLCKIGDKDLKGTQLDYLRFGAKEGATHLGGMEYGTWEGFNPDGGHTAKIEY